MARRYLIIRYGNTTTYVPMLSKPGAWLWVWWMRLRKRL
jgi:hypothetical protein